MRACVWMRVCVVSVCASVCTCWPEFLGQHLAPAARGGTEVHNSLHTWNTWGKETQLHLKPWTLLRLNLTGACSSVAWFALIWPFAVDWPWNIKYRSTYSIYRWVMGHLETVDSFLVSTFRNFKHKNVRCRGMLLLSTYMVHSGNQSEWIKWPITTDCNLLVRMYGLG